MRIAETEFEKSLLLLVDQHGKRDAMSGARKASMILTLDDRYDMVVTATIHDRRRERTIAIVAVTFSVIGVGMVCFGIGIAFFGTV